MATPFLFPLPLSPSSPPRRSFSLSISLNLEKNSLIHRANFPFSDTLIWYTPIEPFAQTPSIVYGFFVALLEEKQSRTLEACSLRGFIDIDVGGISPIFTRGSITPSPPALRAAAPRVCVSAPFVRAHAHAHVCVWSWCVTSSLAFACVSLCHFVFRDVFVKSCLSVIA